MKRPQYGGWESLSLINWFICFVSAYRRYYNIVTEEFLKIHELKISKLREGYSSKVTLAFNSWFKDEDMFIKERRLTNMKWVKLIKTLLLNMPMDLSSIISKYTPFGLTTKWKNICRCPLCLEMFSLLVDDFYSRTEKQKETEFKSAECKTQIRVEVNKH